MSTATIPKRIQKIIIVPRERKIPSEWVKAKGIWPDKIDPVKYQRKLRKQYRP